MHTCFYINQYFPEIIQLSLIMSYYSNEEYDSSFALYLEHNPCIVNKITNEKNSNKIIFTSDEMIKKNNENDLELKFEKNYHINKFKEIPTSNISLNEILVTEIKDATQFTITSTIFNRDKCLFYNFLGLLISFIIFAIWLYINISILLNRNEILMKELDLSNMFIEQIAKKINNV